MALAVALGAALWVAVPVAVLVAVGGAVWVGLKLGLALADAVAVGLGLAVLVEVADGLALGLGVRVEVAVAVAVEVAVALGVGVLGIAMIWMASTLALSAEAGPNWMVIWPPLGLMLLKTWSSALLAPPALAKRSKLLSTCVPSMDTLKTRWPAAVQ